MTTMDVQITAVSSPFLALLTALFLVALAHPDAQMRARAERLLTVIFRVR
ncbi:hypothetical protein [Streptomyces sp. NPDC002790]